MYCLSPELLPTSAPNLQTPRLTPKNLNADFSLPRTGVIEGIHKTQRRRSRCTTGRQVTGKIPPELRPLVYAAQEYLFVYVFKRKIKGLRGKVTDDVGHVTTPITEEPLFFWDADECIDDTWKNGERHINTEFNTNENQQLLNVDIWF